MTLWVLFCSPGKAVSQSMDEYNVKAAFVFNFIKFTTWPEGTFKTQNQPFELCVLADESLENAFQTIQGKKIGTRTLNVHFLGHIDNIVPCNILFIGKNTQKSDLMESLEAVHGKPVLTIGEILDFTHAGGVINFMNQKGKLRFEINQNMARLQQVKLSSRLLKLAIIVGD